MSTSVVSIRTAQILTQAHTTAANITDDWARTKALIHIATTYTTLNNPDKALTIAENITNNWARTKALIHIATTYTTLNNPDKALTIAENITDDRDRIEVLTQIATTYATLNLSDDIKARLDALSKSTGRPAAFYVREAVSKHLDELEWVYTVAARAESIRRGAGETRTIDDVARDLGFEPDELRAEARDDV